MDLSQVIVENNLSDKIRQCRDGVVNNPYQGTQKRVLFVCSMGLLRSATGAALYANKYNTRSAGSWIEEALVPVSVNLLAWAQEVVFVNKRNYRETLGLFGNECCAHANVIVLDIPDRYERMHPELVKAFEEQYESVT